MRFDLNKMNASHVTKMKNALGKLKRDKENEIANLLMKHKTRVAQLDSELEQVEKEKKEKVTNLKQLIKVLETESANQF